ncbi:MAG: GntP family permease, partial [Planctomycetes bacterium]|nr:GntP family permease [Planctomycetota bacterium]
MKIASVPFGLWLATALLTFTPANAQNQDAPSTEPDAPTATADSDSGPDSTKESKKSPGEDDKDEHVVESMAILVIGIAMVLGLIIFLKVNAFIALISAALVVSFLTVPLLEGGKGWSGAVGRVAKGFGDTVTSIGIVIALAAVIGKCLLDSGAADRIVRAFLKVLGVKGSPVALMGSGFVLAVPVFFDTVFYLLVPLARSLHKKTKKNYLMYIMAIGAGGAITHTLVPPTPGPLAMASNLGFDIGVMIVIGSIVALPAAFAGLVFCKIADRMMDVPMREVAGQIEPDPLKDEELPSLFLALLPIALPVLMIATNTVMSTIADSEHAAHFQVNQIEDWPTFRERLRTESAEEGESPGKRIVETLQQSKKKKAMCAQVIALIKKESELTAEERAAVVAGLNEIVLSHKKFHRGGDEEAFLGFLPSKTARNLLDQGRVRMKRANVERMNRALIESAYGTDLIAPHRWETPARKVQNITAIFGNPSFALLISTVIALWLVVKQRKSSRRQLAELVEHSLMSGGLIILITAGGGAFGKMLETAQIGPAIESLFGEDMGVGGGGLLILVLSFLVGSLLKIAQGSGTVSMIVGTSIMASIVAGVELQFHPVYIA